jgi:hypothetical protein
MVCWFTGTNYSSTKCLMFQVLFFSQFLAKFFAKIVSIYLFLFFDKFTKIKSYEGPNSIRNFKNTNAWNIRRLVKESFVQANQRTSIFLDCRILRTLLFQCLPHTETQRMWYIVACPVYVH